MNALVDQQITLSECVEALLAVQLGIKAARYALENGDVDIEQIDQDVCEDGVTPVATAHLSDGGAVAAFMCPDDMATLVNLFSPS